MKNLRVKIRVLSNNSRRDEVNLYRLESKMDLRRNKLRENRNSQQFRHGTVDGQLKENKNLLNAFLISREKFPQKNKIYSKSKVLVFV
ncbi:CLUMA_CG018577, isoform A [Clunio marinus]|uniref:CLUMA_CG018577, isoform A n=1 Tax=Clunio marinus TaxID=568069 RepID=A0A1J1IYC0_9DIPT|nr:CLUMA_CG018577, isoform A [Clunio marinus]